MMRFAILALLASSLFGATCASVTQHGVTWTFDTSYTCGQFATGDWWVVGPITITAMDPAWDGTHNGWEVNPLFQTTQGFNGARADYSAGLRPSLPLVVSSGSSVVKVIGGSEVGSTSVIQNAAVLTVLGEAPPGDGAGYFRPPYSGTDKPLLATASMLTNLLPSLAPTANTPTLASVETAFSLGLRMDHKDSDPRDFRPYDVMSDYQPSNTVALNEAMLRFMLNDSVEDKTPALIQFTQHTLDQAYIIKQGYRRSDDGHNPNHRILAAWAAELLDISEIKTYLQSAIDFHEDEYLYEGIPGALFGQQTGTGESFYWNYVMLGDGSRSHKDPYGYIDGGDTTSGYQNIVSQSFKGQALIYELMPSLKNNVPSAKITTLVRYAARWKNVGYWTNPDPAAPFDGIPENYGITFGPNGSGSYIPGSGRFPLSHGVNADAGQYKSQFVASMWDAYYPGPGWSKSFTGGNYTGGQQ